MTPSARTRSKTKTTREAKTRTHFKKKLGRPKTTTRQDIATPTTSPWNSSSVVCNDAPKIEGGVDDLEAVDDVSTTSACSTPKAQRFRIPEILTCPPAPKKKRVISSNFLFRRSPIAFFAPPDLELFFCFANGGISV
ncbi:hypothetical protein D8674_021966 [Pyrus ussuriensis x Pyrus communis]|uniref:Uncharacterized protein n=1 Tax=Pyrus ussuriensis x Pyrus communis TaxID=2448454 RepID=A0A5N5GJ45_9ROSA|nr:hypothetical protein D8674_021966 [Pyrus ussuriensis x Pyrus communis]